MFNYKEKDDCANPYRKEYLDGLDAFIKAKQKEVLENRDDLFSDPEEKRTALKEMLGYPLTVERKPVTESDVKKELLFDENGVKAYRMQFRILDFIPFYGVLFVGDENEKRPFVLAQHGGLGTPEMVSGIIESGSHNYNDMVQRIIKCGANVFAPQLLLWNEENPDIKLEEYAECSKGQRRGIDNALKQLGSSITAIEIYCLQVVLDYFEGKSFVDKEKIGMAGLSYGGFYTLYLTALDKRIKSALSSCFYNDRFKFNWPDWVWNNSAEKFLDAELLALVYPRKICIQVGKDDPLFIFEHSKKEFERFEKARKKENIEEYAYYMPFDGVHEFSKDDAPIIRLIEDLNN